MHWEIEEDILVLCLYFAVSRRAVGPAHPQVIELSNFLRRGCASIAMRTGNYAAIDPENENAGLNHPAQQTQNAWNQYHADLNLLQQECSRIRLEAPDFVQQREPSL
ncbi:hypothetical protein [Candidatus Spongiihabitans sp.]|uniref:hypothetical protein n=1 Tax=Candidatus Spongiihabitans sp. TaxID=3101308 RepID=UPI003C6ECA5D